MAPSSRWNFAIVAASSFLDQLKLGEQLYGQLLARELRVDALGERLGFGQIRRARLAPHHVGVRRVRETAVDRHLEAVLDAIEALGRAIAE
jgi:hypothetical protein